MAKKKVKAQPKVELINPEDLVVNGVYQTWVQDIVKILKINKSQKKIVLYNVSGSHKQWIEFKNISILKRFY